MARPVTTAPVTTAGQAATQPRPAAWGYRRIRRARCRNSRGPLQRATPARRWRPGPAAAPPGRLSYCPPRATAAGQAHPSVPSCRRSAPPPARPRHHYAQPPRPASSPPGSPRTTPAAPPPGSLRHPARPSRRLSAPSPARPARHHAQPRHLAWPRHRKVHPARPRHRQVRRAASPRHSRSRRGPLQRAAPTVAGGRGPPEPARAAQPSQLLFEKSSSSKSAREWRARRGAGSCDGSAGWGGRGVSDSVDRAAA